MNKRKKTSYTLYTHIIYQYNGLIATSEWYYINDNLRYKIDDNVGYIRYLILINSNEKT